MLRFAMRCCGLAVAVLRFKGCGLVEVAVCGLRLPLRLRLRLGPTTAFRGMVSTKFEDTCFVRAFGTSAAGREGGGLF